MLRTSGASSLHKKDSGHSSTGTGDCLYLKQQKPKSSLFNKSSTMTNGRSQRKYIAEEEEKIRHK